MQVTATNLLSTSSSTTASSSTSGVSLDANFNTFLQLLVTEMKNQDPTKPMDPTQTVSQLATFSGVEQAVQTNSKLDSLLSASNLSQAIALVGHTVTSADGSTSGVVASVSTSSSGFTVNLANGQTIALTPGIKVS